MIGMEGEVICQICNKEYKDNNLPRILTMCGHTYCQICISKMIISNISEQQADCGHPFLIQCPQDGSKMKLTVNQLKSFPKNLALLKVLEAKKSNLSFKDESFNLSKIVKQQQIQQDDQTTELISAMNQCKQKQDSQDLIDQINADSLQFQSKKLINQSIVERQQHECHKKHKYQEQNKFKECSKQQDQLCLLHQKPLEIICIIDHKKICSKCAIFGQHKGHQFKSIQQVQKLKGQCYLQILQIFKDKQQIQQRISNQETKSGLIQILNKKRDFLEKEVRQEFRRLREQISKQQKVVLRQLQDKYKTTQIKITSLLKIQDSSLKQFVNWQVSSYELLKILQDPQLQPKIDILYSKQQKTNRTLQKGYAILSQIKQQQKHLVSKVQAILIDLQCKKDKKIFDFLPEYVQIRDMTQKITPKVEITQEKSRNMAISTLIIQNAQNIQKDKIVSSNCTIFDGFHQKNNLLQGSPLLQQSLLEGQQLNIQGSSSQDSRSKVSTFNQDFSVRLPLRPKQNLINKNIQQDSINCSFTHLELESAKKMSQKTAHKRKADEQFDFFDNARQISTILTGRPSVMKKNQNSEKPTRKKLKNIKISQKYEKILDGIYNNTVDTIDLTNAQVGDQTMLQICEFVKYSKARTIKFIRNKLTDVGVQKLLPSLTNAQILNLSQNNLTEATIDIFIKHRYGYLSGLKNLILSQNKIIQRKHKAKIDQLRAMNIVVSV